MLSEKAKGKQRARDPLLPADPVLAAPEPELPRELNIRFTEGISDLLISLEPQESVKDVKKKVWATLSNTCHVLTIVVDT